MADAGDRTALGSLARGWRALSRNGRLLVALAFLGGAAWQVQALLFNLYLRSLAISPEWIGWLNGLPTAATLLFALPLAGLGPQLGYRRSLLIGFLLTAVGTVGFLLGSLPRTLAPAVFLIGLGGTLSQVLMPALTAASSRRETRVTLFSLTQAASTLAGVGGAWLGGRLPGWLGAFVGAPPESPLSYRLAFLTLALWGLLQLPLLLALEEPEEGDDEALLSARRALRTSWGLLRLLDVRRLVLVDLLVGVGAGLTIPFLNLYFKERFAAPDPVLGNLYALLALLMGLAMLAAPAFERRWGRLRSIVGIQLASIPFLLLMGYSPWFPVAALAFLVRGALMNAVHPIFAAFSMERVRGPQRPALSAWTTLAWNGGWFVGTNLSGLIQARWGFVPLFALTSLFYLIQSGLTWRFWGWEDGGTAGSDPAVEGPPSSEPPHPRTAGPRGPNGRSPSLAPSLHLRLDPEKIPG